MEEVMDNMNQWISRNNIHQTFRQCNITDFPFRSFIAAYFKAQVNRHTKIRIIDRSFRDTNFHLFVHGKDVSNVKTFAANVDIGSSVEAILHSGSSV